MLDDKKRVKILRKVFRAKSAESTPLKILRCRTINTAFHIMDTLHGIPFSELSYTLYLVANDVKMDRFIRLYESQIEMAIANPDRFLDELHDFMLKMKKEIADNADEFLLFIHTCFEAQIVLPDDSTHRKVLTSFMDLCIQNTCYLVPNLNIQSQYFVGRKTNGKWLFINDPMPYADVSDYLWIDENVAPILPEKRRQELKLLQKQNKNYQYTPFTRHLYLGYETILLLLSSFIDNRTYDWVPRHPFNEMVMVNYQVKSTVLLDNVQNQLIKRNKLLPSDGITFTLESQSQYPIKRILLIESLKNGNLFLIFKAESELGDVYNCAGDFCGFYNMRDKITGSLISVSHCDSSAVVLNENLMTIILSLYASYVCKGFKLTPDSFFFSGTPLIYKLKQRSANTNTTPPTHASRNPDKYAAELRNVNGYIRRLPAGQRASRESLLFAEQIGLELAENETFVHPHSKTVLVLKK